MAILTKDEAQALLKKVLSYSKADECEVNLSGSNNGNIRYARNAVSTSGGVGRISLVVSSAFGKKYNRLSDMPICVMVTSVMYSRNHCLYVPKVATSKMRTRMSGVMKAAIKPAIRPAMISNAGFSIWNFR